LNLRGDVEQLSTSPTEDAMLRAMTFRYELPELLAATLVARRSRFAIEAKLPDGEHVIAGCANTGRMEGLTKPGRAIWLSRRTAETGLRYLWESIEVDGVCVGANTMLPNRLVKRLLETGELGKLLGPRFVATTFAPEQKYGDNRRIDFLLGDPKQPESTLYLEVKNCHVTYPDGAAYFPDGVSERATHHVEELAKLARKGIGAAVLFVVQRSDVKRVRPSDVHDPEFAKAVRSAAKVGVTFHAITLQFRGNLVERVAAVPVELAPYDTRPVAAWCTEYRAEAPAWSKASAAERLPMTWLPAATRGAPKAAASKGRTAKKVGKPAAKPVTKRATKTASKAVAKLRAAKKAAKS
jgi:sugar fermentation stimulation protein A